MQKHQDCGETAFHMTYFLFRRRSQLLGQNCGEALSQAPRRFAIPPDPTSGVAEDIHCDKDNEWYGWRVPMWGLEALYVRDFE
jgi:hypothetical protein